MQKSNAYVCMTRPRESSIIENHLTEPNSWCSLLEDELKPLTIKYFANIVDFRIRGEIAEKMVPYPLPHFDMGIWMQLIRGEMCKNAQHVRIADSCLSCRRSHVLSLASTAYSPSLTQHICDGIYPLIQYFPLLRVVLSIIVNLSFS